MRDVKKWLESTGMKVEEGTFERPPNLPYVVYFHNGDTSIYADSGVYCQFQRLRVELYTKGYDESAKNALENLFREAGVTFQASGFYVNSKFYQSVYEIEL